MHVLTPASSNSQKAPERTREGGNGERSERWVGHDGPLRRARSRPNPPGQVCVARPPYKPKGIVRGWAVPSLHQPSRWAGIGWRERERALPHANQQ
eukprot:scaffold2869_cov37-Tisochrysis_lutea.AAC.2